MRLLLTLLLLCGPLRSAEPLRDAEGVPLPEGAVMRLGTTRLRLPAGGAYHGMMAISGDGKRVAVVEPGQILVWEVETGKLACRLDYLPETDGWDRVALSADGHALLVSRPDKSVRAWKLDGGESLFVHENTGAQFGAPAVGFRADGTAIYCCIRRAEQGWIASVHDAKTQKEIGQLDTDPSDQVVEILADGKTILSRGAPGEGFKGDARLHDATTLKLRARIEMPPTEARLWQFGNSADGGVVYRIGQNGKLIFRNTDDGSLRSEFPEKLAVDGIADRCYLSWDGKFVVINRASDYSLRLFDTATGKLVRRLEGQSYLHTVEVSRDGRRLVSREGGRLRVWDLTTGKELHLGDAPQVAAPHSLRYSPDGKRLLGAIGGHLFTWRVSDGKLLSRWDTGGRANSTHYSPDGTLIAASGYQMALLLDARSGEVLRKWSGPETIEAAFYDAGARVAVIDFKGKLERWDVATARDLGKPGTTAGRIFDLGGLPQADRLAGTGLKHFSVIAPSTGKVIHTLTSDALHGFRGQAVSADGRYLGMLRTADNTWLKLDLLTGKTIARGGLHPLRINSGSIRSYSSGHRRFAASMRLPNDTGGHYKTVLGLVDLATGERTHHREMPFGSVDSIAFSPDGRYLATGNADTTVLIWDLWNFGNDFPVPEKITAETVREHWNALDGEVNKLDGRIRLLCTRPDLTVALLQEKLTPDEKPDAGKLASLLRDLGSERFVIRERATKELAQLGELVGPELRLQREQVKDEDARTRIEAILSQIETPFPSGERLRAYRGIEILERIDTPEAKELLKKLSRGAPEAALTREAKAALWE